MSRAFVKEPDGLEAFEDLPDKLISEHRNIVTADGLAMIEAEASRSAEDLAAAQAIKGVHITLSPDGAFLYSIN